MKRILLLTTLTLLLFNLFILQAPAAIIFQQDNTDVAALQKKNASLKSELVKERTTLSKQIQRNDSSIAQFKAAMNKQQAAMSGLQAAVNNMQTTVNDQQSSLAIVGQSLHKRKMFAIAGIIVLLILVIYILSLARKVSVLNADLIKKEASLNQNMTQASVQMREFVNNESAAIKELVEKKTAENKNRIVALLADTNQIVHNLGDQVNKNIETKIAALKSELIASTNAISERLNNLSK